MTEKHSRNVAASPNSSTVNGTAPQTVFTLPFHVNQRLYELFAATQAAQRIVDAAVEAAQREFNRYNDAIATTREIHGIDPNCAVRADYAQGTLTILEQEK